METNTGNKETGNYNFLNGLFERINLELERVDSDEEAKRSLINGMRCYVEGILRFLFKHNENSLYDFYSKKFIAVGFKFKSLPEYEGKMN